MTVTATRISSLMSCRSTISIAAKVVGQIVETPHITDKETFEAGMLCGRFMILVQDTLDLVHDIFPDLTGKVGVTPHPPDYATGFKEWLAEIQEYFEEADVYIAKLTKQLPIEDGDLAVTDEAIWAMLNR